MWSTPALSLTGSRTGCGAPAPYRWNSTERMAGAPVASTSSSRPQRDSWTTPPRTREWVDVVSLGQSGAVDECDVVPCSGQEQGGRCSGAPGADDDDVVVALS